MSLPVLWEKLITSTIEAIIALRLRETMKRVPPTPASLLFYLVVPCSYGIHRAFRYQKFRTVYGLVMDGHELEVAFDETPIGHFLEIEGDGQTVLQVLKAAGLSEGDIIRESYPELQATRCKQRGVPLEDLVFED